MRITREQFKDVATKRTALINGINTLSKETNIAARLVLIRELQKQLSEAIDNRVVIYVEELKGKSNSYRIEFNVIGQFEIWFYPNNRRWIVK